MEIERAKGEVEAIAYRLGCEQTRTVIEWRGGNLVLIEVRCGELER